MTVPHGRNAGERSGPGGGTGRPRVLAWVVGLTAVLCPLPAAARQCAEQRTGPSTGAIVGSVLAAGTSAPVRDATVALEPLERLCRSPLAGAGSSGRSIVTTGDGAYEFRSLPRGRYQLTVRRLGYRSATVDVTVDRARPVRISFVLLLQPVRLEPIELAGPPLVRPFGPAGHERPGAPVWDRVSAVTERQRQFLTQDARRVTHTDIQHAVAPGGADLLRGLRGTPGVTTSDKFAAGVWSRGAPWSQTRVYFDGVPMLGPLHAFGALSAINTDAVGDVVFQPGVRSAAIGAGAAATLHVTSRSGALGAPYTDVALSPIALRASTGRRFASGRGGWAVTGRRSYVDLLTTTINRVSADAVDRLPYAFADFSGRVDVPVGRDHSLEVSGLWHRDGLRGDVPNRLVGTRGHWGGGGARATFDTRIGAIRVRQTVGISRWTARIVGSDSTFRTDGPTHPTADTEVQQVLWSTELRPPSGRTTTWRAGVQVAPQSQRYDGMIPLPYPIPLASDLAARGVYGTPQGGDDPAGRLQWRGRGVRAATWAEVRHTLTAAVTVDAGMRIETGSAVANHGRVRTAPRLVARYKPPAASWAVALSAGRSYQYIQAVARTDVLRSGLYASTSWTVADDTVPAIRADVATIGGEYWLGAGVLGSLNLYARAMTGIVTPDRSPGTLGDRPVFVVGATRSRGAEVSLRKLRGRFTWSGSYSRSRTRMRVAGWSYPTSTEREHVFDAASTLEIGGGFDVSAAYTAASGTPFTRVTLTRYGCDESGSCARAGAPRAGAPNQHRTPPYANLDASLSWRRAFPTWTLQAYMQLHNVLGANGGVTYNSSCACTSGASLTTSNTPIPIDTFERRLPRLPILGIRIGF